MEGAAGPTKATRTLVVALAAFALLFFWSQTILFTFRVPIPGATVNASDTAYRIVSLSKTGAAYHAGLRVGDVVPSAPSTRGPGDIVFGDYPQPASRLTNVVLPFERDGRWHTTVIHPQSAPVPWPLRIRITARLLSHTVFVLVGACLVWLRPNMMTWLLLVWSLGAVAPSGDIRGFFETVFGADTATCTALTSIDLSLMNLSNIALPLFALRFPNDRVGLGLSKYFGAIATALAFYAIGSVIGLQFFWDQTDSLIGYIDTAIKFAVIAIFLATYLQARGVERQRLRWGIAGALVGVITSMANELARTLSHHSEIGIAVGAGFTVVAVLMPVCFAYAVIRRHEIIDVNVILRRTTVYSVLTIAIVALFSLVDWVVGELLHGARWTVVAEVGSAVIVGVSLNSMHARAEDFVHRVLFRKWHIAEQRLARIAEALQQEAHTDSVTRALVDDASSSMSLASAALLSADESGRFTCIHNSGCVFTHLLENSRQLSEVLTGAHESAYIDGFLAIPLRCSVASRAIALYGTHDNGEPLDPLEVDALQHLAQAACGTFDRLHMQAAQKQLEEQEAYIRALEQRLHIEVG